MKMRRKTKMAMNEDGTWDGVLDEDSEETSQDFNGRLCEEEED